MTNADKFKNIFGLYATELWSMPEKDFLKWLNSEAMNCSEIPNGSDDTISRQAAIKVIDAVFPVDPMKSEYAQGIACGAALAKTYVEQLPSAQTATNCSEIPNGSDDTISRQAAMTIPVLPKEHRDYISFELDDIYEQGWNECQKFIAELPSADRPQGEWIFRREFVEDTPFTGYRCSNCNYWQGMGAWNFCPHCGCRMKGADDE